MGAGGLVYANDYMAKQAKYQVDIHNIAEGAHLEFRRDHYITQIGLVRIRIDSVNSEKRDWQSHIYTRRNNADVASQEAIQHFEGMIQTLDETLVQMKQELTRSIKQRDFYQLAIQRRTPPVKP